MHNFSSLWNYNFWMLILRTADQDPLFLPGSGYGSDFQISLDSDPISAPGSKAFGWIVVSFEKKKSRRGPTKYGRSISDRIRNPDNANVEFIGRKNFYINLTQKYTFLSKICWNKQLDNILLNKVPRSMLIIKENTFGISTLLSFQL